MYNGSTWQELLKIASIAGVLLVLSVKIRRYRNVVGLLNVLSTFTFCFLHDYNVHYMRVCLQD